MTSTESIQPITWLTEGTSIRKAVGVFARSQASEGVKLGFIEPDEAMLEKFEAYMELLDAPPDIWVDEFVFEYRRIIRIGAGTQEPASGVALKFIVP